MILYSCEVSFNLDPSKKTLLDFVSIFNGPQEISDEAWPADLLISALNLANSSSIWNGFVT